MSNRINIYRVFVVIAIIISFAFIRKDKDYIPSFNRALWRKDRAGCLDIRREQDLGSVLFCNRQQLIGLTSTQIVKYLGKPNFTTNDELHKIVSYCYYIEPGEQCRIKPKDYEFLDVKTFGVDLKNGKVTDAWVAQGGVNCDK